MKDFQLPHNPKNMITPKQFADLLKKSTLDPRVQRALLKALPSFTLDEIQALGKILQQDNDSQKKLMDDILIKRDTLLLRFNMEMEQNL